MYASTEATLAGRMSRPSTRCVYTFEMTMGLLSSIIPYSPTPRSTAFKSWCYGVMFEDAWLTGSRALICEINGWVTHRTQWETWDFTVGTFKCTSMDCIGAYTILSSAWTTTLRRPTSVEPRRISTSSKAVDRNGGRRIRRCSGVEYYDGHRRDEFGGPVSMRLSSNISTSPT